MLMPPVVEVGEQVVQRAQVVPIRSVACVLYIVSGAEQVGTSILRESILNLQELDHGRLEGLDVLLEHGLGRRTGDVHENGGLGELDHVQGGLNQLRLGRSLRTT